MAPSCVDSKTIRFFNGGCDDAKSPELELDDDDDAFRFDMFKTR